MLTSTTWRGADAWLIQGERLEAVITAIGGHLACLRSRGDDLNPLWQPHWPWRHPAQVGPDPSPWGDWPASPCLAAIVGSNLCLDRFGPPWPGERRPLHGEAGVVPWTGHAIADGAAFATALPEARLQVRREVRFAGDELLLTTAVCHDGDAPRAVEWCEHTTLGDPFLDGAEISAGVSRVVAQRGDAVVEVDPAVALPAPAAGDPPTGSVRTALVDEPWWHADHPRLGRRLRATWRREDFPWLALWTEHRSREAAPWHGRGRTRGMELSTKPFPEGKPPTSRATRFLDRSAECLVTPGAWLAKTIRFAWTRT